VKSTLSSYTNRRGKQWPRHVVQQMTCQNVVCSSLYDMSYNKSTTNRSKQSLGLREVSSENSVYRITIRKIFIHLAHRSCSLEYVRVRRGLTDRFATTSDGAMSWKQNIPFFVVIGGVLRRDFSYVYMLAPVLFCVSVDWILEHNMAHKQCISVGKLYWSGLYAGDTTLLLTISSWCIYLTSFS